MRQLPSVEHQSRRAESAITLVADHGMANSAEVDADLVRASGPDLHLHRVAARTDDRDRLLPFDRRIDGQLVDDRWRDAGEVDLRHLPLGKEARERCGGGAG